MVMKIATILVITRLGENNIPEAQAQSANINV